METIFRSQSVDEFRRDATPTIERLGRTGQAEVLTVDGKPQVVLLSPEAYEALSRVDDPTFPPLTDKEVAQMRVGLRQHEAGLGIPIDEAFAYIEADLRALEESQHAIHEASGGELDDELTDQDLQIMRRSLEQAARGEVVEAGAFFDQLHADLLAKLAVSQAGNVP